MNKVCTIMEETMMMEADSTSERAVSTNNAPPQDSRHTAAADGLAKLPRNIEYFDTNIAPHCKNDGDEGLALWLQGEGLIHRSMPCPSGQHDCRMSLERNTRAVDKVSWRCNACGRRKPLRTRSFFQHINCSVADILKILLAWSEDLDHQTVAKRLDVSERETLAVYERVESATTAVAARTRLGGVVLADMFPACLPHRSPDSTLQHHHPILMLADTSSVPTRYYLHVMSDNTKPANKKSHKGGESGEVSAVISRVCERGSTLVTGPAVPHVRAASLSHVLPLHTLAHNASPDMMRFLQERLWRQAVVLCQASRDVCGEGRGAERCGAAVQRYLHVALHRTRNQTDGFYQHTLTLLARHYAQSRHS